MKKVKDFFSKYGLIAFIALYVIMGMRGCIKSSKITRLEKEKMVLTTQKDSLMTLVPTKENVILMDLKSKYEVYDNINNEMSKLNRQEQMMMFQNKFILPQKEDLENRIKELEKKDK
mgnify:CR=1 FL=1